MSNIEKQSSSRLSSSELVRSLFRVANKKSSFARGETDFTAFTLEEAERIEPFGASYDYDDDQDEPTMPILSQDYHFEALRSRSLDSAPVVEFKYSYLNRLSGILLPANIAMDSYGLEADEAVMEAGPSTLERSINFTIDNESKDLYVCENFSYKDSSDDTVIDACTCPGVLNDGIGYYAANEVKWGSGKDEEDSNEIKQYSDYLFQERRNHDILHFKTLESALKEWEGADSILERLDEDQNSKKIYLAFAVLESMKKAVKKQFG